MDGTRVHRTEEPERRRDVATAEPSPAVRRLTVGAVDDTAERDADLIADAAVATLAAVPTPESPVNHRVRRRTRTGPTRPPVVARRVPAGTIGAAGGPVDADTDARIRRARGGGRPLDAATANRMGAALGADVSHVRIHTGSESRQLNDRIQASAFTVGSEIHFRDGLPDQSTAAGQHLLAHELAHTVQQSGRVHRAATIRRVPARVLVETELRKPHSSDATKIDETDTGTSRVVAEPGKALDVDVALTRTDSATPAAVYVRVNRVGTTKWKRTHRFIPKSAIELTGAQGTGKDPETSWDRTQKTSGKIGGIVGVLPDVNDAQDAFKLRGNSLDSNMESGVGVAAGAGDTVSMITGLASAISAFNKQGATGSDKAGAVISGISSVGTGAKGIAGMTDKAGAGKDATSAAQGIAGFADAFAGIKDTFFAIKHIVELVQEADKLNDKEKFSKSMEIITEAMSAARSGVSSAKAFMELWGGGAGAPLVNAVPGFGIALSCVDIIIRAVDLVESQIHRHRMQETKRTTKEALGGEKGITMKRDAEAFIQQIDDKRTAKATITDAEELKYERCREYLLAKGLQYVSQKRTNRAILKIGVAMGKIAGDAAVLGGASAPVGIGIKGGAMALDVGASGFRRFKQWGRDRAAKTGATTGFFSVFDKNKSTTAKLAGYNKMVDKVFDMIIKAASVTDPADQELAIKHIGVFVGAMGMTLTQMDRMKGEPADLRMAMIAAMQKRE